MSPQEEKHTLNAQPRPIRGKKVRLLRRQGLTPASLFGRHQESIALQIDTRALQQALSRGAGRSVIDLHIDGDTGPHAVLVRDIQRHPISRAILHVDLYQVAVDRPIRSSVLIHLVGNAPAADSRDIMIVQELHTIEVECLPRDLPGGLEVDLSSLMAADQAIHVGDMELPDGVTARADPEILVVHAVRSRMAEEEAKVDAEEEAPAAQSAEVEPGGS